MVQPFVRALPRKIAQLLRFLPPENFRLLFHEIGIAKVLLTCKPRMVWQNFANVSYRRAEILQREKKKKEQSKNKSSSYLRT